MSWRLYREKLVWLRFKRGWSQDKAAEAAGFDEKRHYVRLELGDTLRPRPKMLEALKRAFGLQSVNDLVLGPTQSPEPLLVAFYNKSRKALELIHSTQLAIPTARRPVDLVAMDVDGTIIRGIEFSWKEVWRYLGYPDRERKTAMQKYLAEQLSYEDWCLYCLRAFKARKLKKADFKRIAKPAHLVSGFRDAVAAMRAAGMKLVVVSGGIDTFLQELIPDYETVFDEVFINRFEFSKRKPHLLERINPTPYDFAGKVACIEQLCQRHTIPMDRVAFIGEGLNDRYAAGRVGITIALSSQSQEVREAFDHIIEEANLTLTLPLLGIQHENVVERLKQEARYESKNRTVLHSKGR